MIKTQTRIFKTYLNILLCIFISLAAEGWSLQHTFPIVVIVGRKCVGDNVLVRRGHFFSMNLPCFQIYELFRKKSEVKKTKKKKSDKTSQRFAKILARFTNKKSPTSNRHRQLTKSVRKFYVELSCVECTYGTLVTPRFVVAGMRWAIVVDSLNLRTVLIYLSTVVLLHTCGGREISSYVI